MTAQLENALLAVSNSLTRVVGPAIADEHPLAQQQFALSLAYLGLIRDRLPLLAARERFALEDNLRLAQRAEPFVSEEAVTMLRELKHEADRVLQDRAGAGQEIRHLSARIEAVISEEFQSVPDAAAAALESAVIAGSRSRVELDRAWFLPMGFDPDPDPESVRPVAEILSDPLVDRRPG